MLSEAGLECDGDTAEVEIARIRHLRGTAPVSIGVLGKPARGERLLPARVLSRLAQALTVHLAARRTERLLRRLGYASTWTLRWDHGMQTRPAGADAPVRSGLVARLPRRALVVGAASRTACTLVDAILSDAERAIGHELRGALSIRAETLIVETPHGLLRVAAGAGRQQIEAQRTALAMLSELAPPDLLALAPVELASGRRGIAEWSLETRLPGLRPRRPLRPQLRESCIDFLVRLHLLRTPGARGTPLVDHAELIAEACGWADAPRTLQATAARLDATLADVPRGFGHGDFFHGNVLAVGDRLVGVVDWDAASPATLPFLDLIHLRLLSSASEIADHQWGAAIVRRLLPWARAGGDGTVRTYAERLGLLDALARLDALVLAYWLEYLGYQLRTHPHRFAQPLWLDRNVRRVLEAARAEGLA